jgi:hypothetical protein
MVYFSLATLAATPARGDAIPPEPTPIASDSAIPGSVQTESTMKCIGIKWTIDGDADLDCLGRVEYRIAGAESTWRRAQMLLRVEPGTFNDYGVDPGNLLAGSILDLVPDTQYELRLTLWDPDGGFTVRALEVRTRALPADPPAPRVRYVVPGGGGGTGSILDPFRGIASANASAQPGDVYILLPGTYAGVATFTASGTESNPIVWRGQDVGAVILDGQGTAKPIIDLPGTSYVHFEQMTLTHLKQMAVRHPRRPES